MFDDLRKDAESQSLYEEAKYQPASTSFSSGKPGRFLGMTSLQRFILAFMVMLTVCILGTLALFATGKIVF